MEILVPAAGCIGQVGQFVMGNDPGYHIPYLYNYLDLPGRRRNESVLLDTFLPTTSLVYRGSEDGGGMSAFVSFR